MRGKVFVNNIKNFGLKLELSENKFIEKRKQYKPT